jgi:hypothetical protein
VRARVVALAARLRCALLGVAALAAGNEAVAAERLPQLLTPVLPLVGSPLVAAEARECVAVIAAAAEPPELAEHAQARAHAPSGGAARG